MAAARGPLVRFLEDRARSYWDDAAHLEQLGDDIAGLSAEQWAIIYRTVSSELMKCADKAIWEGF